MKSTFPLFITFVADWPWEKSLGAKHPDMALSYRAFVGLGRMCHVEEHCEDTGGDVAQPAEADKGNHESFTDRVLIAVQVGDHHLLVVQDIYPE